MTHALRMREIRSFMNRVRRKMEDSGATGTCIVQRNGKNTKLLHGMLTAKECSWIDRELKATGYGQATFVPPQDRTSTDRTT